MSDESSRRGCKKRCLRCNTSGKKRGKRRKRVNVSVRMSVGQRTRVGRRYGTLVSVHRASAPQCSSVRAIRCFRLLLNRKFKSPKSSQRHGRTSNEKAKHDGLSMVFSSVGWTVKASRSWKIGKTRTWQSPTLMLAEHFALVFHRTRPWRDRGFPCRLRRSNGPSRLGSTLLWAWYCRV